MISKSRPFQFLFLVLAVVAFSRSGSTTLAPQFAGSEHHRYVIQTAVRNPIQLSRLSHWLESNRFDVAGMNWRRGQVEVIIDQKGLEILSKQGFKGYFVKSLNAESENGPDTRYLNPQTAAEKMKALNQQYPQLTRLEQIGTSLQGRPILALLISDTPAANDPRQFQKPTLLFDGLHHAREIMTPEIVMDAAEVMLKGSQSNMKIRKLVHNWNIWLVPILNVDGSAIVWSRDNMWRKNARGDQDSVYGVDINRNYDYRWSDCNGSSPNKGAQDYHGAGAASEPETKALEGLAQKIRPTASLSYHSYSELVLFPYGCHGDVTPENQLVVKIANELASKLPSDGREGGNYTPGTPWQLLYDVDGSSMDYMYAEFGALSYTFEVNQDFQPPYSLRDPTVAKHRQAWGYFLQRIDTNLLTVAVVDGKTGKPTQALIDINAISHQKGEKPFQTNQGGYFFKVLDPGEYTVAAKLADGRTAQVSVQMNGSQVQTITIP